MDRFADLVPHWPMAITAIGDGAVMLPLAVVLLVAVFDADRTGAALWAMLIVAVLGLVAMVKIAFYAGVGGTGNASGHAALAALVLGGLGRFAPIFLARKSAVAAVRVVCLLLVLGIGVSRIALGYHRPSEVLTGLGLATLGLIILYRRPLAAQARRSPAILILALLILPLTYGNVSSADVRLVELAQDLALRLGWTPPPPVALSAPVPAK